MNYADFNNTSLYIAHRAKQLNITQESISEATGVSQSQVSRVLSGKSKRASKVFIKICNYVNNYNTTVTAEMVSKNKVLLDAIASVWDGSDAQSNALATVIRTLSLVITDHSPTDTTKKTRNP